MTTTKGGDSLKIYLARGVRVRARYFPNTGSSPPSSTCSEVWSQPLLNPANNWPGCGFAYCIPHRRHFL